MIPLVDLAAQHHEIAREVDAGFASVLRRTAFILGDEVAEFERELAGFVGVRHCIGVANGTDARSGLAVVRALEAIQRSLRSGGREESVVS